MALPRRAFASSGGSNQLRMEDTAFCMRGLLLNPPSCPNTAEMNPVDSTRKNIVAYLKSNVNPALRTPIVSSEAYQFCGVLINAAGGIQTLLLGAGLVQV